MRRGRGACTITDEIRYRPAPRSAAAVAYDCGAEDRLAGRYLGQCPYDRAAHAAEWLAWRAGWMSERRVA